MRVAVLEGVRCERAPSAALRGGVGGLAGDGSALSAEALDDDGVEPAEALGDAAPVVACGVDRLDVRKRLRRLRGHADTASIAEVSCSTSRG